MEDESRAQRREKFKQNTFKLMVEKINNNDITGGAFIKPSLRDDIVDKGDKAKQTDALLYSGNESGRED